MYDLHPNDKDGYIKEFERAVETGKVVYDEKMREHIRQQIEELSNDVSSDK